MAFYASGADGITMINFVRHQHLFRAEGYSQALNLVLNNTSTMGSTNQQTENSARLHKALNVVGNFMTHPANNITKEHFGINSLSLLSNLLGELTVSF